MSTPQPSDKYNSIKKNISFPGCGVLNSFYHEKENQI